MHGKLRGELITGFLQNRYSIQLWIEQFRVYSTNENVINGEISGHFDFLESIGKLKIGDYDVLKRMFRYVDFRALDVIEDASKEIKKALQNNKNKS